MDLQAELGGQGATSFDFADTHADAVAAAVARLPAVITSDVHLYEGNGPAAVAEIRARLGHIPVIFITATPQGGADMLATDSVLNKPLDREALRALFAAIPK